MTDQIIFHHYDPSPYSEKVRIAFGLKGLDWQSVQIPNMMPKPDFTPLTGGYRKTPAMQIGADIFCDTQLILEELEVRHPSPTLFPAGGKGAVRATGLFQDRVMFQAAVAVIFGSIGDMVPEDFKKDREQLSGRPFDTDAMKAAVPAMRAQLAAGFGWLADDLADGRAFLQGDQCGLADIHAHMNIWFLKNTVPHELEALVPAAVMEWFERVEGVGHGQRIEMDSKQALQIATQATPAACSFDAAGASDVAVGDKVMVMADDYGRDPVVGTLRGLTAGRISITRHDDALGELAVHFPRIGFLMVKA